jgi:hypothetical protein
MRGKLLFHFLPSLDILGRSYGVCNYSSGLACSKATSLRMIERTDRKP